ncbi:hypothetical protein O3M35_001055 [Rhynocoris fuscipes]|uniref:Uncharacterized protein n=1 Tax=Rhynocoris fuscipes TaxID=488301 RepID=A0AAW1DNW2_9HEMI
MYAAVIEFKRSNNNLITFIFITNAAYPLLIVYFIVHMCETFISKIDTFNEHLLDVALNSGNKFGLVKNTLLFHYAASRNVEFSACGFFKLRYSLIISMVGAAATHVLFGLQLG